MNAPLRHETRHGSQSGFTLVELSIVLVIVGLIIAGVLKGQELLENTRMKASLSQVEASRAAGDPQDSGKQAADTGDGEPAPERRSIARQTTKKEEKTGRYSF